MCVNIVKMYVGMCVTLHGTYMNTIEDVLEPYLIQQGFLQRTPRGRIATPHAYAHFGLDRKD